MRYQDLLRMVWTNVWRNKSRTILTMAAVAIGCTSIIVMVSLGLGVKGFAEEEIKQQGSLLEIRIWGKSSGNVAKEDIARFKGIPHVDSVRTSIRLEQNATVKMGGYLNQAQVMGIDVDASRKSSQELDRGEFFRDKNNGIVVTYAFAKRFMNKKDFRNLENAGADKGGGKQPNYKEIDPLNRKVTLTFIKRTPEGGTLSKTIHATVDGVMAKPKNPYMGGENLIYMDLSLLNQITEWTGTSRGSPDPAPQGPAVPVNGGQGEFKVPDFDEVTVNVDKIDNIDEVINTLKKEQYYTSSIYVDLKEVRLVFLVIQLVLGGVGAIALGVASIGIVNTMIMSIMERTREIAIMKVVGANVPTVRKLFLMESGYIGLFGGLIGAFVSLLLSIAINIIFKFVIIQIAQRGGEFVPELPKISSVPFALIAFGVLFSFGVGLLSGIYPANRAVRLSVLDALRKD